MRFLRGMVGNRGMESRLQVSNIRQRVHKTTHNGDTDTKYRDKTRMQYKIDSSSGQNRSYLYS